MAHVSVLQSILCMSNAMSRRPNFQSILLSQYMNDVACYLNDMIQILIP